ncbi:sensor domain-containing phosphodiesterase [Saccharothrix sp. NPDC042600]|uniref:sensor domain-containing phosphodiesterase n=1 Tax=Saccharothrix TaxID=2071 RepID=UPI0033C43DEE
MWQRVVEWVPGTRAFARRRGLEARLHLAVRRLRPVVSEEDKVAALRRIVAGVEARSAAGNSPAAEDVEARPVPVTATREMVRLWASAIVNSSCPSTSVDTLRVRLEAFAEALASQAAGGNPREWPAQRIGRELAVRMRLTPQSFTDVLEQVVPWLESLPGTSPGRRSAAIAGLAGGFAEGVRARVLDEQLDMAEALREVARRSAPPTTPHEPESRTRPTECVVDDEGRITAVTSALCALLHLSEDRTVGRLLRGFGVRERDRVAVDAALRRAAEAPGRAARVELAVVGSDGRAPMWIAASVLSLAPDTGYRVSIRDMTALRAWRDSLLPRNTLDEVTRLPDERNFLDQVQSTLDRIDEEVTIGMCALRLRDLNLVTRSMGPQARDRVVTTIASRIQAAVAGIPATTVGRLDRDTFAVLVTDRHSWNGVTETVRRLVDWVSQPLWVDGGEIVLASAVGVAEGRRGMSATQLLGKVQVSLNVHDGGARDRVPVPQPRSRAHDDPRIHLLAAFPQALERGEIDLAYTPVVRLRDGVLAGVEVSGVWRTADGRPRQIDDLIELADDIGLNLAWGSWLLRRVVRQARRWTQTLGAAAPRVTMAVPRRFARDGDLVGHVRAALRDTGLPPWKLMLSLPESAVVGDDGHPHPCLVDLGGLSVPLALDGLGTRFRRYDTLPHLALHTIVIPPQLTTALDGPDDGTTRRAVAANLIRMGNDLKHEIVVKGVLSRTQRDIARSLSATLGQGTLFGGPLPPDRIPDLVGGQPIAV